MGSELVGKSTSSAIFCKWLQLHHQHVLAVDGDGQNDLTKWIAHSENQEIKPQVPFVKGIENLDLSKSVVRVNKYLDVIPADITTFSFPLILERYGKDDRHFIIGELIKKLEQNHRWDWIIYDVPPSVSELLVNVDICVKNVVLIMQSQFSSYSSIVESAMYLKSLIDAYRPLSQKYFGGTAKLIGILPYLVETNGRVDNIIMKKAKKEFSDAMLPTIKERQRVKQWDLSGIPNLANKNYWNQRTWKMYDNVFDEIIRRIAK